MADKYITIIKKLLNQIKMWFYFLIIMGIAFFILALLLVGFQTLFGGGGGCGYDLSC